MDFEEYEDPIEYWVTEDKISCDYGDLDYDIDGDTAIVQAISVYRTGQESEEDLSNCLKMQS